MRNSFKFLIAGVLLAFGTMASAGTVVPDQVLDFGTGLDGSAGTIVELFDIDGTTVIGSQGTGIAIGSLSTEGIEVNGTGDAYNNVTHVVTNGFLNFNTVSNTMTIDGTVSNLGITGNLFTGGFTSSTFNPTVGVFYATGGGNASLALLNALDLDAGGFTYVGFSLETGNGNVISTDVMASRAGKGLNPPEVPIPAAAWLMGSGLLGLVGVARRKPA